MSKVLLVNTYAYPNYPSLGLGYIGAYLKHFGHDVRIFDIIKGIPEYEKTLATFHPEFIGLNSFAMTDDDLRSLVCISREASDAIIVVGGIYATSSPDLVFREIKPDILVLGEGEKKMLDIVEGKPTERIDGVVTSKHRSYNFDFIEDLDALPFPDREMMHAREYQSDWVHEQEPFTSVMTGRGCPWDCSFCGSKLMWKRQVRRRSVSNVLEEIEQLLAQGWREIYFVDDTFTLSKSYVLDFCREIRERGLAFTWKSCSRVDVLDRETALAMKKAGCHTLLFGVESGNQKTLDFLNKRITLDETRRAFRICREVGLKTVASIMYNIPGETMEDMGNTFRFARELRPTWVYACSCSPYPNTDIASYLRNHGVELSSLRLRPDGPATRSFMDEPSVQEINDEVASFLFDFYASPSYLPKVFAYGLSGFNSWRHTVRWAGRQAGGKFTRLFLRLVP